jgi:hypothetical protein
MSDTLVSPRKIKDWNNQQTKETPRKEEKDTRQATICL